MICTDKGKKTLNVDHVIEALKSINLDSHIKLLSAELDLSELQNDDNKEVVIENSLNMKDLINKQKKKNRKKVKHEFNEDDVNEQMELFERSKMQNMQSFLNTQQEVAYISEGNMYSAHGEIIGNKKAKFEQIEDMFNGNKKEEEFDFDN
jgi:hypothetical protein